jgi:hypothetical protein
VYKPILLFSFGFDQAEQLKGQIRKKENKFGFKKKQWERSVIQMSLHSVLKRDI